jgi:hypothetical protein
MSHGDIRVRVRRLPQQTCPSLCLLSKGLHIKQHRSLNLMAFKYLKQDPKELSKGSHQQHGPDHVSLPLSSSTSAAGLMTLFQTLFVSGGRGISIKGPGSAPIQCARGSLGDNNPGYPVSSRGDPRSSVCFSREEHLFPQQKAVDRRLFLRASTRPSRSPYFSGATLRVRLCDALFLSRRLDVPEARFQYVSARPPVGQRFDLP